MQGHNVTAAQVETLVNQLNIFAKPFVSQFVKDINALPATRLLGIAPPTPNPINYILSWVSPSPGNPFKPKTPVVQIAQSISQVPHVLSTPNNAPITTLSSSTYAQHFAELTSVEVEARTQEMLGFTLYGVTISTSSPLQKKQSRGLQLWEVIVPGVLEDSPRIRIGDALLIRAISPFDGVEYEAFVYSVVRRTATITFIAPALPNIEIGSTEFNIQFIYTDIAARYATRALYSLQYYVSKDCGRKLLFPEPEDAILKLATEPKSSFDFGLDFFDDQLNRAQKKAVYSILNNKYGDIPYLIWGPPGTGKTKTCIEAIYQIIAHSPNARILACAPSHSAADTITLRLIPFMSPSTLLRFNAATRPFSEVPTAIMPFTHVEDLTNSGGIQQSCFGVPSMSFMMGLRVVVCTCEDAGLLVQCGLTNVFTRDAFEAYYRELKADFPFYAVGSVVEERELFWTHLFLDEAGQATESESAIPLQVVVSDPIVTKESIKVARVILSGDHMQLGPIVHSEKARGYGFNISLFERLIRRPLYRDHPESRCAPRPLVNLKGQEEEDGATESFVLTDCVAPFANLVRNYRSHPSFLMTPSHLFYNDTLLPSAPESITHSFIGSDFLPNPEIPIVFHGIRGSDERYLSRASILNESESSSAAWYNSSEAAIILETVQMLMTVEGVTQKDFGVVPQVIRTLLRTNNLGTVDVGTVEDYQGMERRIILLSTVRSNRLHLPHDLRNDLGLIHFPARLNVALTRAQALLVVVGDPETLCLDPLWISVLSFFYRNGCWKGVEVPERILNGLDKKDVVEGDLGALEKARNVTRLCMEVPKTKWLGASAGDGGNMTDGLEWTQEYLELMGLS
ncbi:hypothetical protein HDU79_010643 [Rhizoclosmatium sp. JEL0117]|nr:hypothetical protein HDU79_010643 [Rhizoclosmatium sp. JEL0117]